MDILISFFLSIYLGIELLDHMLTLCITIWGTARLFSKVAAPFYIPTSSVRGFRFLHILADTCYCLSLFIAILAGDTCCFISFDMKLRYHSSAFLSLHMLLCHLHMLLCHLQLTLLLLCIDLSVLWLIRRSYVNMYILQGNAYLP